MPLRTDYNMKVNAMNIVQEFEKAQMTRKVPDFSPGDTVVVNVKVKEGNRERVQAYEGVVIAVRSRGLKRKLPNDFRMSSRRMKPTSGLKLSPMSRCSS